MESSLDLFDLLGRVAIVTGGSRGIGFAIAEGLASAGASVVIADILNEEGKKASEDLESKGYKSNFIKVDVTERGSVQKMVSDTLVGDTESGPKSDILGQASARIRTDHCLEFPA